jgi:hypothetical protein
MYLVIDTLPCLTAYNAFLQSQLAYSYATIKDIIKTNLGAASLDYLVTHLLGRNELINI